MNVRTCGGFGQIGYTAAIEVHVTIDIVVEAVLQGFTVAHCQFHTPVAEAGSVEPGSTALTHGAQIGRIDEHVLDVLDVGVESTVNGTLQQGEIQTGIVLLGGFPLQVVVLRLRGAETGREYSGALQREVVSGRFVAASAVSGCVQTETGIIGNGLVTGFTPGGTDLQIVQPILVNMLGDTITQRYGRESTEAIILAKAGGAVVTDGEGSQQQVFPVVVHFSEERNQVVSLLDTGGALGTCSRIGPHVIVVLQCKHLGISRHVQAALAIQLDTGQCREMMIVSQFKTVVGRVGPSPLHVIGLREGGGRSIVVHHIRVPCISDGMNVGSIIVDTEIGTEQKTLNRGDIQICISENTPDLKCIIAVVIQFTERVLTVTHTAHRPGEGNAVLFIDRKGRGHLEGVLHRSAVYLGSMGNRQVFADGKPLEYFQTGIHAGCDVLEIGIFQDTLVILVTHRY